MNRKKLVNYSIPSVMIILFMVSPVSEAKAWKLFGKERTEESSFFDQDVCPNGFGKIVTIKKYFLGFKVDEYEDFECID